MAAGQVDLLEPIDLADHLDKVELYLGQVCQIAGISKMQLDYWTNKAQIPTKGKKQRIYDIEALETVMLTRSACVCAVNPPTRSPGKLRRRPNNSKSRICSIAGRINCPAASASALRLAARSFAIRKRS